MKSTVPFCKSGTAQDPAYLFSPGASTATPPDDSGTSSRSPRSPWFLRLRAEDAAPCPTSDEDPTSEGAPSFPTVLDEFPTLRNERHQSVAADVVSQNPVKVTRCPESIREAIMRECAFMKIRSSLYEDRPFCPKDLFDGCCGRFLFFIGGLPRATRTKWSIPLCWSVAQVLRLRGFCADVASGNLYVTDSAGARVRVDFKPSL